MSQLMIPPGPHAQTTALMQYDANKRSAVIGYLLLIFVGATGAHRFYLGKAGTGATMLVLFVLSLLLSVVVIGLLGFAILGLWSIVDLFLVPGMTQAYNNRLIGRLSGQASPGLP